jgi:carbonic anhydrase
MRIVVRGIHSVDNYLIYQGSDTYPPCTPMIWLVAFDLQTISPNQASDFPANIVYMVRETQTLKRYQFSVD